MNTPLTDDNVLFVRNPRVVAAKVSASEVALLDAASENYFGLNEVASFVWDCLQAPHSFNGICERVVSEFEVDREECEREVRICLAELRAGDLIRPHAVHDAGDGE